MKGVGCGAFGDISGLVTTEYQKSGKGCGRVPQSLKQSAGGVILYIWSVLKVTWIPHKTLSMMPHLISRCRKWMLY